MSRRHITVHIEELTLSGFAPADRYRILDAVAVELERLIAASPESFTRDAAIDKVDGGAFDLRRGAAPRAVGEGIARSVHGGLKS